MTLDRREPAVYVTIEDASYVAPTIEVGRTTFGVTLCDRGPHNVLRTISSKSEFHHIYGKPNYKKTSQVHYQLDQALNYAPVLIIRAMPEDSTIANVAIKKDGSIEDVLHIYFFTNNSKIVTSNNLDGIEAIVGSDLNQFGAWIYAKHDSDTVAAQVVGVNVDTATNIYELILDKNYDGLTTSLLEPPFGSSGTNLVKYIPYVSISNSSVMSTSDISSSDLNTCYTFYAVGSGTYYNRLILKGYRNTALERMYTDNDGNVLYPYMFMEVALYEVKDDNTERLLEGPWTVSLIPRLPDNSLVRDLSSGRILFIENIINESSNFIRCLSSRGIDQLIDSVDAEQQRLQVMLLLSQDTPIGLSNAVLGTGLNFENGTDGTGLYDIAGNLNPNNTMYGIVARAYEGSLESEDGSIEQLPEYVYPFVQPDYIVTGGYPNAVQERGRWLASIREDCLHLADTGHKVKVQQDLIARRDEFPWNNWTSALYTQYRRIFDPYTGDRIWMSPVYHAIDRHLFCDAKYFIAEPVAGIEKGNLSQAMDLAYLANHTQRGDMQDQELNFTIFEPQGKYFLTQLSTWRRLSVLKRLHIGKFVMYLRKMIPPLLKDILQRKATQFWIDQARYRVHHFVSKFEEDPSLERYSILKSFSVDVEFDDVRSELNVYLDITPIRAIERINVFIIVH